MAISRTPDGGGEGHVNAVHLRGRVSAPGQERVLPSGDVIVTARLVVRRPEPIRARTPVDTLDCLAWTPRARRSLLGWEPGSLVEVDGAVRRRFRRGPAGLTSRVEIEVSRARRVKTASRGSPSRGAAVSR